MTYICGTFKQPVVLPDGSVAENSAEVDRFLKKEGLAMQSDFSKNYYQKKQNEIQSAQKQALFDAFLTNYKRMIFL